MNNNKLSIALRWIILIVVLVAVYLPIALIIVFSFSSAKTIGGAEGFGEFTFAQYVNLFKNEQIMSATGYTLLIGLLSALLSTVIGTFTAVGIHYMKRAKKTVNFISQITVDNAEIVTAVGFYLLAIFLRDVVNMPVGDGGLVWLIIAHTVMTTPYVILAVSPRLTQLNPNLFEASMDLGAGPMRTLFTVIMPQLIGGMISGFALSFTLSLDDFVVTNMNKGSGSGVETISTYVYSSLRRNLDPSVRALSTILFVTVLTVLIIFNIVKRKKQSKTA